MQIVGGHAWIRRSESSKTNYLSTYLLFSTGRQATIQAEAFRSKRNSRGNQKPRSEKKSEKIKFKIMSDGLLGLLRIRVLRGVNLAVRDVRSSDPYVVLRLGKQKLKTRVVKKNVNPEWNEELTFSVEDPSIPVKLEVYDKDRFSPDDPMGDAEFDIQPFFEAARMDLKGIPDGSILRKVASNRQNCLAKESNLFLLNGKVFQDIFLRLRNTECGEIELQLQWIDAPIVKGSQANIKMHH